MTDTGKPTTNTRLVAHGEARPGSRDPVDVAQAIGEALLVLAERCPDRHFIKYVNSKCDGLRDGIPRGTRHHLTMVFEPFPPHYKRGDQPQERNDDRTSPKETPK